MKRIAFALFILGVPWALIAPVGVAAPIAMIQDISTGEQESFLQVGFGILFSLQCILGFWIWARWGIAGTSNSPSSVRFWMFAALHHYVWLAFAACQPGPGLEVISGILWYTLLVAILCTGITFVQISKYVQFSRG